MNRVQVRRDASVPGPVSAPLSSAVPPRAALASRAPRVVPVPDTKAAPAYARLLPAGLTAALGPAQSGERQPWGKAGTATGSQAIGGRGRGEKTAVRPAPALDAVARRPGFGIGSGALEAGGLLAGLAIVGGLLLLLRRPKLLPGEAPVATGYAGVAVTDFAEVGLDDYTESEWPAAPAFGPADQPSVAAGTPAGEATAERCEIVCWRGYVKSQFIAQHEDGNALAQSRLFSRRQRTPPPTTDERARAAYEQLVDELIAAGWSPVQTGSLWYDSAFEREQWKPEPPTASDHDDG
jgi:hypothetical protein